jgi:hypothetical protein
MTRYLKVTVEVEITEDDQEPCLQALNDALDRIDKTITLYTSDITVAVSPTPENASEIAAV